MVSLHHERHFYVMYIYLTSFTIYPGCSRPKPFQSTLNEHCRFSSAPQTFNFSSVFFLTGPSGSVVTLSGAGFGDDSQLVSVTMNGVACNVTSATDAQVQCTAGNNPGGTYPVVLHHQVKGHARSTVSFDYELTLSAVQPNEGKTEALLPKLEIQLLACEQV